MLIAVKIIGICLTVLGALLIVKPEWGKRIAEFMKEGKRIYGAAVLRTIFGLILIAGAGACRWPKVVLVFGLLCLLSAGVIFFLKREKQQSILQWWLDRPMEFMRYISIVPLALGVLLLLAA